MIAVLAIYMTYCTACHNSNPRLDGSLGPALRGSSLELIEAKVLHGTYPVGYRPKRDTNYMTRFPELKNDIKELYKFLNK